MIPAPPSLTPAPLAPITLEVIAGDALEVLAGLATQVQAGDRRPFDGVFTDPPYSSGGLFRGDRALGTVDKYAYKGNGRDLAQNHSQFSGDSRDQRSFLAWSTLWLSSAFRACRPGAYCCMFTDWRQLPTMSDALQVAGWIWRGTFVWDKTEGSRPWPGRFRHQCEYVLWGTKGAAPTQGPTVSGLIRKQSRRTTKHTAEKPVAVVETLLRVVPPGGWVLDPFVGSGTTLVAAANSGLSATGIEQDADWVPVAVARAEAALPGAARVTVP